MITWMQRHKKWLVITIWISTIAFVGAGFVGWGSYNYGSKGGVIAKVGDREVTVSEYQQEYSDLYNKYAQMFGNVFNEQMAKDLRLKDLAYTGVIQKNLFMSYADSLGLDVTDEDVAKELVKYEVFFKDGKFDKDTYVKVLNQSRLTPKAFEESLKRNILLQKIQVLFEVKPTSWEIENIGKLLTLEDDITIKILSSNDIGVKVEEEGLKKYWEENKNSYTSEVSYDLEIKEIPFIASNPTENDIKEHFDKFKMDYKFDDGKLKSLEEAKEQIKKDLDNKSTKTQALKTYLKLKKDEEKFDKTQNFVESKLPYLLENVEKIKEAKNGEIVKPFSEHEKYFIVKVVKANSSKVLDFEEAKSKVYKDYERVLKAQRLQEKATAELKNFQGTKMQGVTRASKIAGLSNEESTNFLNQLFFATTKEGIITLDNKTVLYKINGSKIGNHDKTKDDAVEGALTQLQEVDLMTNLLKKLETIFSIKSSPIEIKE